jgi:hypothetical protein
MIEHQPHHIGHTLAFVGVVIVTITFAVTPFVLTFMR